MLKKTLTLTTAIPALVLAGLAGPGFAQGKNGNATQLIKTLSDEEAAFFEAELCDGKNANACEPLRALVTSLAEQACEGSSEGCAALDARIDEIVASGSISPELRLMAELEAEAEAPEAEMAEAEVEAEAETEVAETETEAEPEAETEVAETEVEAEVEAETEVAEAETEVEAEAESEVAEADTEVADTTEAEDTTAPAEETAEAAPEPSTEERLKDAVNSLAAAALLGNDEPEAVETEEVSETEETARTSDEDVAAVSPKAETETADTTTTAEASNTSDNDNQLRNILGAAAAGFLIGKILDNGDEVVETTGDRVVVLRDGEYVVRKDENELLRRPGTDVTSQTYSDGSTKTTVTRGDGTQIVTLRDRGGEVLYRVRVNPDGTEVVLIDEISTTPEPVRTTELPERREEVIEYEQGADLGALISALQAERYELDRAYSLRQVRENRELRELMPRVDLDAITFATGSAAITSSQAESLLQLGEAMAALIDENPDEIFLIEGHTDTVGSAVMNLALSDRRAESVALALTEYFAVPPENLVVQGYGERFPKIAIEGDIRENRRATVRRITPLLRTASN